jgi:integrase
MTRPLRAVIHEWNAETPTTDVYKDFDPVAESAGVPFTLHDLRRTFITIAESLDIPAYALKRLLNHKDPNDVTAGYIVSDVNRLREPMKRIMDFIKSKITQENNEAKDDATDK